MGVADRVLVAVGALALVLLAVGAGTAAWLVYGFGTLEVDVRSGGAGGDDVSLRLPGFLAPLAAHLVPRAARGESQRELRELREWLPAARAAVAELRRCPDARILDASSRGSKVRISKRGDRLLAEITEPGEDVRVSVPLRAATAVLAALDGVAGGPEGGGEE